MTKKTIAFQGSIGANSHLACQKFYPDFTAKNFSTFFDVFQAVESGEVEYGMIPLENSYAGRVAEIHNLLQKSSISIVAEHFFTIEHNLAGISGAGLEDVKKIYSHPQALMQCQENIRKLPSIKKQVLLGIGAVEEFSNTAEAAKYVASQCDKSKAAICSKAAAEINGLEILKKNMQDVEGNFTVFAVISKKSLDTDPTIAPIITAILFTIKNATGSLYEALGKLAMNKVSMLKLESYIPSGSSKEACFFILIEGHPNQKNVSLALKELGLFSQKIKILGSYYADKSRS